MMKLKKTLSLLLLTAAMASAPLLSAQDATNPMDEVGANHNRALDCLMRDDGPADATAFERVVKVCGYDPGVSVDEFVERNKPLLDLDYDLTIAKHMEAFRDSYTDEEFAYFGRIDAALESSEDAKKVDASLAALEQEAVAKLDAKSPSSQSVLGAISTARHSLAYWQPIYAIEPAPVGVAWWPWRWRLYWAIRADIIGYLYTGSWGAAAVISYYYWRWWWWWRWWWRGW
jgi:hypothetical protein